MHKVSGKPHQIPIRRNSKSKVTAPRANGVQSLSIQKSEPEKKPLRLISPSEFRQIKEYIPRSISSPLPDERHSPELTGEKINQSSDAPPKRINRTIHHQNRTISPPNKSMNQQIQEPRVDLKNRGSITPPPGLDLSHMLPQKREQKQEQKYPQIQRSSSAPTNVSQKFQPMKTGPPQLSNVLVRHCQNGILNLFAPNNYYEYRTRVPSNETFEHFMSRVFVDRFAIYRNYLIIIREARGSLLIRRKH